MNQQQITQSISKALASDSSKIPYWLSKCLFQIYRSPAHLLRIETTVYCSFPWGPTRQLCWWVLYNIRAQTLGSATRQIKQPSACMELLCHKRNLIQEQQPFSSLTGLQNPLKEELAALALSSQHMKRKAALWHCSGGNHDLPFTQPATGQCHVTHLSSKLHPSTAELQTFSTAKYWCLPTAKSAITFPAVKPLY